MSPWNGNSRRCVRVFEQVEVLGCLGDAPKMMKLYDALDDNDDVQKVYANFDIDESEME